jgi:hypothetical protein
MQIRNGEKNNSFFIPLYHYAPEEGDLLDRKLKDVADEDIIRDFNAGMTHRALAEKYGMGTKAIRYRLNRNGIKPREGVMYKLTYCVICGSVFEQDLFGRRKTCSNECRTILHHITAGTIPKSSPQYKYPWGHYIKTALYSLCDELLRKYSDRANIPYSFMKSLYRSSFGVDLIDPVLRSVLVQRMTELGYEFDGYRFKKRIGK